MDGRTDRWMGMDAWTHERLNGLVCRGAKTVTENSIFPAACWHRACVQSRADEDCMCMCVYIYIYVKRERDIAICIYIYIYMCTDIDRAMSDDCRCTDSLADAEESGEVHGYSSRKQGALDDNFT